MSWFVFTFFIFNFGSLMRNFLLPQNPQHTRFCSHIDEYLQTFHCEWCVADHGHVIVAQAKAALKILTLENPDKIRSPFPHISPTMSSSFGWMPILPLRFQGMAYHAMAFQPSHILEIAIRNWKR
eukprot:gene11839-8145_t